MSRLGRHLPWLTGALVAAGSVALAFVAPASWWGATFALGVLAGMLAARPVVRAAYRPAWTRSVAIVTFGAVCGGGAYAFAVEPWGPVPQVAWPLGLLLLVVAFAPLADMVAYGGTTSWLGKEGKRYPDHPLPPYERRR